jgi:hypothetical protein
VLHFSHLVFLLQSVRLVQILEQRGVPLSFFQERADEGLDWLNDFIDEGNQQASFFREVLKRHRNIIAMNECDEEADILYRMAAAELSPSEPYYADRRRKFVKKTVDRMRKKARYPMHDCWHVRMIPDHLQLLQEGEAFVAVTAGIKGSLSSAKEVLAFRNPSYFDGDLRKLKLVQYEDLILRAGNELVDKVKGFFGNLQANIVLSTLDLESEAERLSGGDFDGDKAWICFSSELVERVTEAKPAPRPAPLEVHIAETTRAHEATMAERVKLARHYKHHQRQLGVLANTLDSCLDQFDCWSDIEDVSEQAFLQVDHPYQLCEIKSETRDKINELKQPQWAVDKLIQDGEVHAKVYKSTKAMGRLFDYVEGKIESAISPGRIEPDPQILELARGHDFPEESREKMRTAAVQYRTSMYDMLQRNLAIDCIADKSSKLADDARKSLILSKSEDERSMAAAVLYDQCGDSKSFAWKVAWDYLLHIVTRSQSSHRLPPVMTMGMERVAFAKHK